MDRAADATKSIIDTANAYLESLKDRDRRITLRRDTSAIRVPAELLEYAESSAERRRAMEILARATMGGLERRHGGLSPSNLAEILNRQISVAWNRDVLDALARIVHNRQAAAAAARGLLESAYGYGNRAGTVRVAQALGRIGTAGGGGGAGLLDAIKIANDVLAPVMDSEALMNNRMRILESRELMGAIVLFRHRSGNPDSAPYMAGIIANAVGRGGEGQGQRAKEWKRIWRMVDDHIPDMPKQDARAGVAWETALEGAPIAGLLSHFNSSAEFAPRLVATIASWAHAGIDNGTIRAAVDAMGNKRMAAVINGALGEMGEKFSARPDVAAEQLSNYGLKAAAGKSDAELLNRALGIAEKYADLPFVSYWLLMRMVHSNYEAIGPNGELEIRRLGRKENEKVMELLEGPVLSGVLVRFSHAKRNDIWVARLVSDVHIMLCHYALGNIGIETVNDALDTLRAVGDNPDTAGLAAGTLRRACEDPKAFGTVSDIMKLYMREHGALRKFCDAASTAMEIEKHGGDSAMFDYFTALFRSVSATPHLAEKIQTVILPPFVNAASRNIANGSTDFERYSVALAVHMNNAKTAITDKNDYYKMFGNSDALYERIFSSREGAEGVLESIFKLHGISGSEMLTTDEKITIMNAGGDYMHNEADSISAFAKRRNTYSVETGEAARYFNVGVLDQTRIVRALPMANGAEAVRIAKDRALDLLVYGINGSRHNVEAANHALAELVDKVGYPLVNMSRNGWDSVKGGFMNELKEAYGRRDYAAVEGIFRSAAAKIRNGAQADALRGLIDVLDAAAGSEGTVVGRGIVAYTVKGKDNIIGIDSATLGACCYLPSGGNHWAALRYANDPGIVIVNFSVAKMPLKARLEDVKVNGTAIGALGVTPQGTKVLYIDSLEGGDTFREAIRGREGKVLEVLEGLAREAGAEKLAFYTKTPNQTPRDFLKSIGARPMVMKLRLLLRQGQYIEGFTETLGHYSFDSTPEGFVEIPVKQIDLRE